MTPETFTDVRVVGMHFRGQEAKDVAAALTPGETLTYEREPTNPYDSYAIRVFYDIGGAEPFWLGFIAKENAAWIAPWMDDGWEFTITVTGQEHAKNNVYPLVTLEPAAAA